MESDDEHYISDDIISSFTYIPYEILLTEIFPHLSVRTINTLCSVNSLFNELCNDETLWKIKITNEYPTLLTQKPDTISWKNYYREIVSKTVLVYYHGDIISNITFIADEIKSTINPLIELINATSSTQIAFINSDRKLLIGVQYPDMIIKYFSSENKDIVKILLIDGNQLDLSEPSPPSPPRISRGRKSSHIIPERKIIHNDQDYRNNNVILKELTSPLGTPAIYGFMSTDFKFRIIDNTNSFTDSRIIPRGKICSTFQTSDLKSLLQKLDPNFDTSFNYQREQLCEAIEIALSTIGHII